MTITETPNGFSAEWALSEHVADMPGRFGRALAFARSPLSNTVTNLVSEWTRQIEAQLMLAL